MTEYWFYHLETSMLEGVLPELLDKTRARGWRALVALPKDRANSLDEFLWTYKDESFLPHGRDDEPMADQQPIVLASEAISSAGFECVFLIDGHDVKIDPNTDRVLVMIDGRNQNSVQASRMKWKELKSEGATLSYWQQNDRGKWEKNA